MLICPRSRIFVHYCLNKGPCYFHLRSPTAKAKSFLIDSLKIRFEIICIWRWRFRNTKLMWSLLFCKVILITIAKCSCPCCWKRFHVIKFITPWIYEGVHNNPMFWKARFLWKSIEHFRFGGVSRAVTNIIAVRYGDRHFFYNINKFLISISEKYGEGNNKPFLYSIKSQMSIG